MNFQRLLLKLNGYDLDAALAYVQEVEDYPQARLERWRDEARERIVSYHLEHNPKYRSLVGHRSDGAWGRLPIVEKPFFLDSFDNVVSGPCRRQSLYRSRTSGTSGTPMRYYKNKFCHAVTWAIFFRRYADLGVPVGSKEARFYGIPGQPVQRTLQRLRDLGFNRKRFVINRLDDSALDRILAAFSTVRFDYIYGYANAILLLARRCRSKGTTLREICPSLKVVLLTAEMSSPEDRGFMRQAFGVEVYSEYGCSEFGYIGFESSSGVWRVNPAHLFVETDPESGSLLVTDLTNEALPFIRYRMGDLAVVGREPDSGVQILTDLQGRVNDILVLPGGIRTHAMSFYYIAKELFADRPGVEEFQILQKRIDLLEFRVRSGASIDLDRLKRELDAKMIGFFDLEPGAVQIEVALVDRIERSAAGKFKHFVTEL